MKRPKSVDEKLFAGLDLHSNNVMIAVINQDGKRVAQKSLDCNLDQVVEFLKPLKPRLQAMAVESTFNWYWLLDGLRERGYPIDLANPAKIQQYSGLKHVDDEDDAFHIAELQRLLRGPWVTRLFAGSASSMDLRLGHAENRWPNY